MNSCIFKIDIILFYPPKLSVIAIYFQADVRTRWEIYLCGLLLLNYSIKISMYIIMLCLSFCLIHKTIELYCTIHGDKKLHYVNTLKNAEKLNAKIK